MVDRTVVGSERCHFRFPNSQIGLVLVSAHLVEIKRLREAHVQEIADAIRAAIPAHHCSQRHVKGFPRTN